MKIGDMIARKDMPQLKCKIVGESDDWGGIWYVEELYVSWFAEDRKRQKKKSKLFITKDDDRWFVVDENTA